MLNSIRKNRRVINVASWNVEFVQPLTIRCRPSGSTLAGRLAATFILGLIAIALYFLVYPDQPQNPAWDRFLLAVITLLVFFAVLAPLSLAWRYVDIRRENKKLVIKRCYWIPATLTFSIGNLRSITILASEMRNWQGSAWRWRVLLFGELGGVDFWVDTQRETPQERLAPTRVADFVKYLQQLVPLPYQGPQIIEWHARKTAHPTGLSFTVASEPVSSHQTYHSLEEVPPEMRPQAEKMMQEALHRGVSTVREQKITVRNADGSVKVYNSLDQLPPDLRARFEAAKAKKPE